MKKLLLLFACIGSLLSCSDDNKPAGQELNGKWTVTKYLSYTDPLPTVEEGDILFTLDMSNKNLTIESDGSIITPGSYDFAIAGKILTIDRGSHKEKLKYSFDNDVLVLQTAEEGLMDGAVLKLKRYQVQ